MCVVSFKRDQHLSCNENNHTENIVENVKILYGILNLVGCNPYP